MADDQSVPKPNLKAPDFQDTLDGAVPGNIAAEHGTLLGSDPNSVIGDHKPHPEPITADAHPAESLAQSEEVDTIREHQIDEYEDGVDDGKG